METQWYEDESNFPCVVYDTEDEEIHIARGSAPSEDKNDWIIYIDDGTCHLFSSYARLATDEEIDSLKIKD